jgi:glyoxylase-like metal-dependent hydrolase (beta-lactamase superfamily II)
VTRLTLGGETIRLVQLSDGESKASAVLYLPTRQWLFSGDLVFSGVHAWLVDNRARAWRQNLQRLRDLGTLAMIYPGHGETGDYGLLDRNTAYLQRFSKAARAADDAENMFDRVNDFNPFYRQPHLLRLSAEAVMSARGRR